MGKPLLILRGDLCPIVGPKVGWKEEEAEMGIFDKNMISLALEARLAQLMVQRRELHLKLYTFKLGMKWSLEH